MNKPCISGAALRVLRKLFVVYRESDKAIPRPDPLSDAALVPVDVLADELGQAGADVVSTLTELRKCKLLTSLTRTGPVGWPPRIEKREFYVLSAELLAIEVEDDSTQGLSGFHSANAIAERLGVHPEQREAFVRQLNRQRKKKRIKDKYWSERANRAKNTSLYLYDIECPLIWEIAERYKRPRRK